MIRLFDRYTGTLVSEYDLPNHIDLGRYGIIESNRQLIEVTYSTYQTKKTISQDLLLEENSGIQDLFIDISIEMDHAEKDSFSVIPLIRRIRNKIGLTDFEKLLHDKLFHLEEIFRNPHSLLTRETEKVPTSRAKRIPVKSYQHLASHTEDWVHKSIISFTPSHVLHEELNLNFEYLRESSGCSTCRKVSDPLALANQGNSGHQILPREIRSTSEQPQLCKRMASED
jgi:hypothetical protein